MGKEYRMDVTIGAERDRPKIFRDIMTMLDSRGISAETERDANGDVCAVAFTAEQGRERDIADSFLLMSKAHKEVAIRIGYEEQESGAYGYGVVRNGKVLDSFVEERGERASPLAEELRLSILDGRQSFEEAYRLHEPKANTTSDESIYLLLGWNSCQRVLANKVKDIMTEKLDVAKKSFTAEDAYGAYFRKLAPTYGNLGSEQLEKLDEEIAHSMLRQKFKVKEIGKAVRTCSPNARIFVKPHNLGSYAAKVIQAARQELDRADSRGQR